MPQLEEDFYNFNPWWEEEFDFRFFERPKYSALLQKEIRTKQIIFITGLRRVGKTTLMKSVIKSLLKKIPPKKILYLSLDALSFEKYSIAELVREFRKLHSIKRSEKIYLFFDEAAYRENIHLELKNLYDAENAKIFVTSSSASILRDKKALLTGRSKTFEILPLDFTEYLLFNRIETKRKENYLLEKYFEDYMKIGGMPEFVLTKDITYLNDLIEAIIYKDIAYYYGVKDLTSLKDFFRLLMERVGKQASLNKMAKVIGISPETAKRYFEYFASVYLIYPVERCGKLNERLRAPKKVYCCDVGIRNYATGFRDKGAIFENLFYLKIKDENPCYFYKNGNEIDFYTNGKLIEIKFNREINEKQRALFEKIEAQEKIIIGDIYDFLNY
jgi:predicted AAA+ superfamily ATPase